MTSLYAVTWIHWWTYTVLAGFSFRLVSEHHRAYLLATVVKESQQRWTRSPVSLSKIWSASRCWGWSPPDITPLWRCSPYRRAWRGRPTSFPFRWTQNMVQASFAVYSATDRWTVVQQCLSTFHLLQRCYNHQLASLLLHRAVGWDDRENLIIVSGWALFSGVYDACKRNKRTGLDDLARFGMAPMSDYKSLRPESHFYARVHLSAFVAVVSVILWPLSDHFNLFVAARLHCIRPSNSKKQVHTLPGYFCSCWV